MITFYVLCAAMIAAAALLVARPLLKTKEADDAAIAPRQRHIVAATSVLLIPLIAIALYASFGRLHWQKELADANSQSVITPEAARDVEAMISGLEKKLREQPNNPDGWLMLGRSYVALGKLAPAVAAYEKALDQTGGASVEATLGLAEALVMEDELSLMGRAGELFETVLAKEPDNPKALWYGAVSSIANGNLARGRDRLKLLLSMNPPEQVKTIVERQIQDLNEQLASGKPATDDSKAAQPSTNIPSQNKSTQDKSIQPSPVEGRALQVQVSLAPALAKGLAKDLSTATPLFVLARDPAAGGPPLAAVRRVAADLPLSITLSDADAMIKGRGISSVAAVQVVARLSKSGTPQAQPGDLYGQADYTFDEKNKGMIKIVIDRVVQ